MARRFLVFVYDPATPPAHRVRCDRCRCWGGRSGDDEAKCALFPGLHAPDFGCAYFQLKPELIIDA